MVPMQVMRLVLLRAMVVCWALCVPIVIAWQSAESIMIALGQNPGGLKRAGGLGVAGCVDQGLVRLARAARPGLNSLPVLSDGPALPG